MPKGEETLEVFYPTVLSCSLATLLRNKCMSLREGTRVAEGAEAILVCERERGSRQASVCFCAGEGDGQAAAQCSAQLLCELVLLSVCLLPFLLPSLSLCWAGLALSA